MAWYGFYNISPLPPVLTIQYPGKNGDEWISFATALMKKKDAVSYEEGIFKPIMDAWKRLKLKPAFRLFLMDFEQAEMKAAIGTVGLEVCK
jgi:hypothetical protein